MRRNQQRSSDGPMPYGPSGQPTPPEPTEPAHEAPAWGAETPTPPSAPADPGTPPATPPVWGSPSGGEIPPPFSPNLAPPPPPAAGQAPGFGALPPVAQWAPPPGAYSTSVPGAPGLQYGRTLDRVMAWILDSFIVAIPSFVITIVMIGGAAGGGIARLNGPVLIANVISIGISVLYFVAFWTGSSRATPGMRLMKLQMGDAATGAVPTVQQGLIRWFSLGGAISIVAAIPVIGSFVSFVAFIWELLLLATTATSPTKQGIHDRIAKTALVQPMGAQTPAKTCLGILIALFVLWIVGIIALIAIGGQVSTILSSVGTSI